MMNETLSETEYCDLLFQQCYFTCKLYRQEPFKVEIFPPDERRKTCLIFKSSPRGAISTKKLTVKNQDCDRLKGLLMEAYPNLVITELDPLTL